mmetsp:Transcript_38780/g.109671  ORF Transcript_38780/g.109671 Transcript_38780/m.109671 type:complete len:259 (-) Transcript_38780:1703-2479(-)
MPDPTSSPEPTSPPMVAEITPSATQPPVQTEAPRPLPVFPDISNRPGVPQAPGQPEDKVTGPIVSYDTVLLLAGETVLPWTIFKSNLIKRGVLNLLKLSGAVSVSFADTQSIYYELPTPVPTTAPTLAPPTEAPTLRPTPSPTLSPTAAPTLAPSPVPTLIGGRRHLLEVRSNYPMSRMKLSSLSFSILKLGHNHDYATCIDIVSPPHPHTHPPSPLSPLPVTCPALPSSLTPLYQTPTPTIPSLTIFLYFLGGGGGV